MSGITYTLATVVEVRSNSRISGTTSDEQETGALMDNHQYEQYLHELEQGAEG